MSWLPIFLCICVGLLLMSFFFWYVVGVLVVVGLCFLGGFFLLKLLAKHYTLPFIIFVFTEIIFFFTAVYVVLSAEREFFLSISDYMGLPLLSSCLLLGSSVTAAGYHSNFGRKPSSGLFPTRAYLLYTVMLGSAFVSVQLREFYASFYDCTFDAYYAACFFLVGLHFFHVLIGLAGLWVLWCCDYFLSFYHINLIVWYWHFVDYIWLVVYGVVYLT